MVEIEVGEEASESKMDTLDVLEAESSEISEEDDGG